MQAHALTLRQAWEDRTPGCEQLGPPFARPVLRIRLIVKVAGHVLSPHRFGPKAGNFIADVFLRDGRTLRLLLPPEFPCHDLHVRETTPLPADRVAADLGFGPRDPSRPVRDSDRLLLDLTESDAPG